MRRFITPVSTFLTAVAVLFAYCPYGYAQSAKEKSFLSLYFTDEELEVVSATRSLTSISRVAENITVVTASEIELMNAHTVAEVLNTVTGVQVEFSGGPGLTGIAYIQGSETRHVVVIIDGVVLNNISNDVANLGQIPVQNIQKIEIIKGPASSAWGSALGGVVNIITKSGSAANQGAFLSGSYGKKGTGDFRVDGRGKQDRVGYYLTAGRIQSDGLTPHFKVSDNNAYAKLSYDLTNKTDILLSAGYSKNEFGDGQDEANDVSFDKGLEISHVTLALNSALNRDLDFNISAKSIHQDSSLGVNQLSTGSVLTERKDSDKGYGSSAKLTWRKGFNTVVIGADYDDRTFTSASIAGGKKEIRKTAVFANDTLTLGAFAFIPGIRHDKTNTNGDFTSPSFGATYTVAENTIFRVNVARGFNVPTLVWTYGDGVNFDPNPDLKMETVWSQQAGIETAALKYVWLKASAFKNDIRDAITQKGSTLTTLIFVNSTRQRRQGIELEAKTAPVYNAHLTAGAELIDAKDLDTGQRVENVPRRVYDIGLHYINEEVFNALLVGRYIDWNASSVVQANDSAYVFDLHVSKKLYQRRDVTVEAFASEHNIFNKSQYRVFVYVNPSQWFEGGIRMTF